MDGLPSVFLVGTVYFVIIVIVVVVYFVMFRAAIILLKLGASKRRWSVGTN